MAARSPELLGARGADIVKMVLPYWTARTRRVENERSSRWRSTM
ncbi:MAG: hypothetical protein U0R27_05835 [Candidatus Nanopelagicales bacterium]